MLESLDGLQRRGALDEATAGRTLARIGAVKFIAPVRRADLQRTSCKKRDRESLHRPIRHHAHWYCVSIATRGTGEVLRNEPGKIAPQQTSALLVATAREPPASASVLA